MNDLWEYKIETNSWTFLAGTDPNSLAIYVPPNLIPSSRREHTAVVDEFSSVLVVYGGYGYGANWRLG